MNMRGVLLLLLLGLAAGSNGCVMQPKQATSQKMVKADSELGLSDVAVPRFADGWWQAYHDPQLNRLIEQSLLRSPTLDQAVARLRSAQAQADAQHANAYPNVAFDGGVTRVHLGNGDELPGALHGGNFWLGNLLANFSWDIDIWGRQSALIASASAQSQASALDIESAKLMLAGAMAQAYVDFDRDYALADIAARSEAQRQHIIDITRKRIAAGLDTQVELRQAEGALPQARVEHQQAQTAAELARHALAMLTGDGANAYAGIERPQVDLTTALPLPKELPGDLLARRPDVLAARMRLQAADSQRVAAKAAFYPTIELTGYAGLASIGLSNLFEAPSQFLTVGPTLRLPLFDAGRLRANYRGAEAQIDTAIADYNDTVLRAVQQTANQLSTLDGLQHEIADQQQSLDAAEDAYRIAEVRYRAGLAAYLSVLNAETTVLATRRDMVDLIAQQATARVSLLLALGGSFDPTSTSAATSPPAPAKAATAITTPTGNAAESAAGAGAEAGAPSTIYPSDATAHVAIE